MAMVNPASGWIVPVLIAAMLATLYLQSLALHKSGSQTADADNDQTNRQHENSL